MEIPTRKGLEQRISRQLYCKTIEKRSHSSSFHIFMFFCLFVCFIIEVKQWVHVRSGMLWNFELSGCLKQLSSLSLVSKLNTEKQMNAAAFVQFINHHLQICLKRCKFEICIPLCWQPSYLRNKLPEWGLFILLSHSSALLLLSGQQRGQVSSRYFLLK